jgi:signal transduction histidine kinase
VRLVQVFTNLLENAAKYTPEDGEITMKALVLSESVEISITDNGIGITAQALPHIFDLFVQDDHAAAHNRGGLGIGLAVVRELVEAHGGTVVASSAGRDLGSRFTVTLPISPSLL